MVMTGLVAVAVASLLAVAVTLSLVVIDLIKLSLPDLPDWFGSHGFGSS
jgi:hypothetical protein